VAKGWPAGGRLRVMMGQEPRMQHVTWARTNRQAAGPWMVLVGGCYMYLIIKVDNYLQAIRKVELSHVPLLQTLLPSTTLPSDLTLTVLNYRYEK